MRNITGQEVLRTQETTIDISSLPSGVFIVEIQTEKANLSKKLIVK